MVEQLNMQQQNSLECHKKDSIIRLEIIKYKLVLFFSFCLQITGLLQDSMIQGLNLLPKFTVFRKSCCLE